MPCTLFSVCLGEGGEGEKVEETMDGRRRDGERGGRRKEGEE